MADILTGWQGIAGTAIIISIILSGIALGLGRAFSFKRLERFGADEIIQAIINSAILGFVVALSAMVVQVGVEFTPQMGNITCFTYYNATTNTTIEFNATALIPPDYVLCGLNATAMNSSALTSDMIRIENNIGYYQSLALHFGNLSIQPLVNLDSVSTQLSNSLYLIQFATFASAMNAQFLSFVSSGWFGTIFAAGLVLRSFFLSRKFGAFLIAVAIGLIIFYPLMIMMFQPPRIRGQHAESHQHVPQQYRLPDSADNRPERQQRSC